MPKTRVSKERLISVLMKDGTPRRVGIRQADKLVSSGQAKRFISNTIYRALKLGIEVKDLNTRDDKGTLRKQIREARAAAESVKQEKSEKKREKSEKKPKREKTRGRKARRVDVKVSEPG